METGSETWNTVGARNRFALIPSPIPVLAASEPISWAGWRVSHCKIIDSTAPREIDSLTPKSPPTTHRLAAGDRYGQAQDIKDTGESRNYFYGFQRQVPG